MVAEQRLRDRAFFTTSDAHFVLFQSHALAGDHIVVVPGCSAPLVLRQLGRHDDRYEMKGLCYVYEHVNREALFGSLPVIV